MSWPQTPRCNQVGVPLVPLPSVQGPPAAAPLTPNGASGNLTRVAQPLVEDNTCDALIFKSLDNPQATSLDDVYFDAKDVFPLVPPPPAAF